MDWTATDEVSGTGGAVPSKLPGKRRLRGGRAGRVSKKREGVSGLLLHGTTFKPHSRDPSWTVTGSIAGVTQAAVRGKARAIGPAIQCRVVARVPGEGTQTPLVRVISGALCVLGIVQVAIAVVAGPLREREGAGSEVDT